MGGFNHIQSPLLLASFIVLLILILLVFAPPVLSQLSFQLT